MPRLYPDLWTPRLGYLLADLAAIVVAVACVLLGLWVYHLVDALRVIGDGVIATGTRLDEATLHVQHSLDAIRLPRFGPFGGGRTPGFGPVPGVQLPRFGPFGGGGLPTKGLLSPLDGISRGIVRQGQDDLHAVDTLATVLGVSVGGMPLAVLLLRFVPWRIRKTRGLRSLDRLLHTPGSHDATASMELLAARALYTLPYDVLLHYSKDPIAEWRDGRHHDLAKATMAAEGLDVKRYLRRVERYSGPPPLSQEEITVQREVIVEGEGTRHAHEEIIVESEDIR